MFNQLFSKKLSPLMLPAITPTLLHRQVQLCQQLTVCTNSNQEKFKFRLFPTRPVSLNNFILLDTYEGVKKEQKDNFCVHLLQTGQIPGFLCCPLFPPFSKYFCLLSIFLFILLSLYLLLKKKLIQLGFCLLGSFLFVVVFWGFFVIPSYIFFQFLFLFLLLHSSC